MNPITYIHRFVRELNPNGGEIRNKAMLYRISTRSKRQIRTIIVRRTTTKSQKYSPRCADRTKISLPETTFEVFFFFFFPPWRWIVFHRTHKRVVFDHIRKRSPRSKSKITSPVAEKGADGETDRAHDGTSESVENIEKIGKKIILSGMFLLFFFSF